MPEARGHHYVSQCYLKGFTRNRNKDEQLIGFDLDRGKKFAGTPANLAKMRDFNRIDVPGYAPDHLEGMLSRFETILEPALGAIISSRRIEAGEQMIVLLNFIAHLVLRNPRLRRKLDDFMNQSAKIILRLQTETRERFEQSIAGAVAAGYFANCGVPTYEEMRAAVDDDEMSFAFDRTHAIKLEFSSFEKVVEVLHRRTWLLVEAMPDAGHFVTSDHPVCLLWQHADEGLANMPPGLALKGTFILFPISSTLAAIGLFDAPAKAAPTPMNRESVSMLNQMILGYADKQVYAGSTGFFYRSLFTGQIAAGDQLETELVRAAAMKHQSTEAR